VRKIPYILAGSLALCAGNLQAEDDVDVELQNVGSEQMIDADKKDDKAFRISVRGDWIQETKIHKKKYRDEKLKFYEAEAELQGVVYYNPCFEEGIGLGLSYNTVHLHWRGNPYFGESNFPQVSFSVAGFSKRAPGWLWQAKATINWQTQKKASFSDYTNYDLLLWGRYEYCPDVLWLHTGFVAQTGMKIDRIFPIIGFDWVINDKWKLNAVFPLNLSIVYSFSDKWSIDLAGRLWSPRRRVKKHEELSEGLFRYRNSGAELGLNYNTDWFRVNAHIGYAFGGVLTISDRNNKHKKHIDFDSSSYAGGELVFKF